YRSKSGPLTKQICFKCRSTRCYNRDHNEHKYNIGWKFEYPKKRHVKEWKKLETAMKNKDTSNPMVKRSVKVVHEPEHELYSWAHLYGNSHNIERTKFPRHKKWIDPEETKSEKDVTGKNIWGNSHI